MRLAVFGILTLFMLIAGCAQSPAGNNQTPPGPVAPPVQPPAPVPQPPPVPPPSNQSNHTPGNISADDDMFMEDLGKALDDLDAVTDPSDLEQTSPNTYCDSDNDCWCRIFDGAQFLPGKAEWSCDMQAKRCQRCIYY